MNPISFAINSISAVISNGVSSLAQSATDAKVQKVALYVLATLSGASAVALVVLSLSGIVTAPVAFSGSVALVAIAYGLILMAQYLEQDEVDLDFEDVDSIGTDNFEDAIESEFDDEIIFGNLGFIEAMNVLDNQKVSYCFFRGIYEAPVLLYRKSDETFGRDCDIAKNALEGVDPSSLLDKANLQAFKNKLHQMALKVISGL